MRVAFPLLESHDIPDAAHWLHHTHRDDVIRLISAFCPSGSEYCGASSRLTPSVNYRFRLRLKVIRLRRKISALPRTFIPFTAIVTAVAFAFATHNYIHAQAERYIGKKIRKIEFKGNINVSRDTIYNDIIQIERGADPDRAVI
jgi:hypothetical protein